MAKEVSRYTLLRRACTSSEKKALTRVKRYYTYQSWFEDHVVPVDTKPSYILPTLFVWSGTPQGHAYWASLCNKLKYLEESKGW